MKTSFNDGFSIKLPNGEIHRFGCCTHHDDAYSEIVPRANTHAVLTWHSALDEEACLPPIKTLELPEGTLCARGFHDDEIKESGGWRPLP